MRQDLKTNGIQSHTYIHHIFILSNMHTILPSIQQYLKTSFREKVSADQNFNNVNVTLAPPQSSYRLVELLPFLPNQTIISGETLLGTVGPIVVDTTKNIDSVMNTGEVHDALMDD